MACCGKGSGGRGGRSGKRFKKSKKRNQNTKLIKQTSSEEEHKVQYKNGESTKDKE